MMWRALSGYSTVKIKNSYYWNAENGCALHNVKTRALSYVREIRYVQETEN
jgi:hypothetical protein